VKGFTERKFLKLSKRQFIVFTVYTMRVTLFDVITPKHISESVLSAETFSSSTYTRLKSVLLLNPTELLYIKLTTHPPPIDWTIDRCGSDLIIQHSWASFTVHTASQAWPKIFIALLVEGELSIQTVVF
jgi:hypothetical protein